MVTARHERSQENTPSVGNAICASQSQAGFRSRPLGHNKHGTQSEDHNNRDHTPQLLAELATEPGPGLQLAYRWVTQLVQHLNTDDSQISIFARSADIVLCFLLFYTFSNTCSAQD